MSSTKPQSQPCRACGTPVPLNAPCGHCPRCLIDLGFGPRPEEGEGETSVSRSNLFGDYELVEQIGRGGMGVVYKARQVSLNRLVALKMLSPHASAFPDFAERIRLEAEAAGSLRHPHIVTIYDVGEHEGQPFFSMELIEGSSLAKLIRPDGFSLTAGQESPRPNREHQATTARIVSQIARAVDHAHKHGVLHRDLKPGNVLLDPDGQPHLTDFGLAKVIGRTGVFGTASGAIMGTPAYMAPEQAAGETKHVSTAADIYSLGAILYEMLAGCPPFHASTPLETLRQVAEQEPKPPTTLNAALDRDLATICLKCLQKDPARRYSTALALAEDLERWSRGEPIEARPVRTVEKLWRWCRRQPLLATMTVGIALLLVATTVFALMAYRVTERRLQEEQRQREDNRNTLWERIEQEWEDPARRYVRLKAEELGVLSDRPITRDVNETAIKLGVQLPGKDRGDPQLRIATGHPALAYYLRTNLAPRPVLCDVYIYKSSSNAVEGLLAEEVDIMQLNPASYVEARVKARRRGAAITPLVAQTHGGKPQLHGAIFVRTNSGIDRLETIRGRSFAFAEWDSAIGHYLPKVELLAAGLRARDLSGWTNSRPWHAIRLVREGQFAAGAADLDDVEKLIAAGAPLRVLRQVSSPGTQWVASTNVEPALLTAIQQSLLSLTDNNILAGISRGLTGFRAVTAADYDELEQQMQQAALFDR